MSSDAKDPAQEFAERVTDEWFKFEVGEGPRSWRHVQLIVHIANELRAEGWVKQSGQFKGWPSEWLEAQE